MKRSEIAISASLVPIDYLMVVLAGIASYYVRFWEPIEDIRPVIFNLPFGTFMAWLLLFAIIWVISFMIAGLYSMKGNSRAIDEVSKIILGCSTAVMALMFIFFFSRSLFESRFIILFGWVFSIIIVMFGRGIVRFIQRRLYRFDIGVHRVVIIGEGMVAERVIGELAYDLRAGFKVVGQFSNFDGNSEHRLQEMKQQDKFDEILVATPNLSSAVLDKLNDFSYVNHVGLKYVADIFDYRAGLFANVERDGAELIGAGPGKAVVRAA